ncbi:MAG: LacI family DNA-binding transcriptional regulator, partial [Synergistaceae bacterium]|nr:LacI family DNA-binding transcriptional regulator [Synergistaceae bacterium]
MEDIAKLANVSISTVS